MKIYQIKDWNEHFENSKSRERDHCSFVCVPNKQHGLSFSKIMSEKDGSMIYGIWCLILGACSQQKKPRNGWLTVDGYQTGTAWVPEDLALKFRRPKSEIIRALEVIASKDIGWIIDHECPPSTRSVPAECPSGIVKEEKERIERKEEASEFPLNLQTDVFRQKWDEWLLHRKEIGKKLTPSTIKKQLFKLSEWGPEKSLKLIDNAIEKGWMGFYETNESKFKSNATSNKLNIIPETEMTKS